MFHTTKILRQRNLKTLPHNPLINKNKGFTLVELLIVISILSALAAAVVVVINPAEMLRQGRDATRMGNIGTLHRTLSMFQIDRPGDSMGSPGVINVSIPSDLPDCANLGLPPIPGWVYRCVPAADLRNINGTGWIPINFTTMSRGSPLSSLPVDPVNTVASGAFYVFVTDGRSWTLASLLESERHAPSALRDGGTDAARFEAGTNLSLWTSASGLVGYWSFDGTGSIANNQIAGLRDESGRGNHGTASNANATGMAFVPGRVGNAISLDGVDDVVDCGNIGAISNFTIELWFNSAAVENHRNLLHTHFPITGHENTGVRIEQATGGFFFVNVSADNVSRGHLITNALIANRWYHLVIIRNGNTLLVYLDNVLRLNTSNTSWPSDFPRLRIGVGHGAFVERWFRGLIDEVRIYNRALSAAEIRATFNATR